MRGLFILQPIAATRSTEQTTLHGRIDYRTHLGSARGRKAGHLRISADAFLAFGETAIEWLADRDVRIAGICAITPFEGVAAPPGSDSIITPRPADRVQSPITSSSQPLFSRPPDRYRLPVQPSPRHKSPRNSAVSLREFGQQRDISASKPVAFRVTALAIRHGVHTCPCYAPHNR